MSSILDALAKLEASRQPTGLVDPGRPPAPAARRPLATMLVVGAFVAGAGVAGVVLWRRPVETPAVTPAIVPAPPPAAPTVMAEAPVAPPPEPVPSAPVIARAPTDGLRAAPPVAAPAGEDLPWARPVTPPPPAEPAAPATGRLAVALAPNAEPMPLPAVPPEPPPVARPPEGAPSIRLSFLLYSAQPERRSVALTIDGGGLTTLHEGDEHEGVEVVRIHRDHADLRWQGETFTVEAR